METSSPITHLPAELFDLIAEHALHLHLRLYPYPIIHRKARCPCLPRKKREKRDVIDGDGSSVPDWVWRQRDGVLALSMTCKTLRRVVFEEKPNRSVPVGLCTQEIEVTRSMTSTVRNNTKTLRINTHPSHAPPQSPIPLNDILPLFPSLENLVVNWNFRLAHTAVKLPPSPPQVPWNDVISLTVNFGEPKTCDRQTPAHPLPLMDELSDILHHLFLPSLTRLSLKLDFAISYHPLDLPTYPFPDTEAGWAVLTERLAAVRRFEDLEEVEVQVLFGGSHPTEMDYWTILERIGLNILKDSQIKSLAFHMAFHFPPDEESQWVFDVEDVNNDPDDWDSEDGFPDHGREDPPNATISAKYVPHEQDLGFILDNLRHAHPILDRFRLSIDGSTSHPGEREMTSHLLDYAFARQQDTDDPLVKKDFVRYQRNDEGIRSLYYEIVEIMELGDPYGEAIDAEMAMHGYGYV